MLDKKYKFPLGSVSYVNLCIYCHISKTHKYRCSLNGTHRIFNLYIYSKHKSILFLNFTLTSNKTNFKFTFKCKYISTSNKIKISFIFYQTKYLDASKYKLKTQTCCNKNSETPPQTNQKNITCSLFKQFPFHPASLLKGKKRRRRHSQRIQAHKMATKVVPQRKICQQKKSQLESIYVDNLCSSLQLSKIILERQKFSTLALNTTLCCWYPEIGNTILCNQFFFFFFFFQVFFLRTGSCIWVFFQQCKTFF